MLTKQFTKAVDYAREQHKHQTRKGANIPYLYHLLGVASLVIEFGGDEEQAIAGLLHDIVEDQGEHHADIVRRDFGERVARIVMACTDGSQTEKAAARTPEEKRANWESRKIRYVEHLRGAPDDVLLVSGCDKLHNARAILQDLRNPDVGVTVFDRFTGKKQGTLWYYRALSDIFTARQAPMARELNDVVTAMERDG